LKLKALGKKFRKYGEDILNMVKGLGFNVSIQNKLFIEETEVEKPHTVSSYLDILNNSLRQIEGRIQGEVTGLDIRSSYLFFH